MLILTVHNEVEYLLKAVDIFTSKKIFVPPECFIALLRHSSTILNIVIKIKELLQFMIVDDHVLMREGVKQLLEFDGSIEVIAEAADGLECLECFFSVQPVLNLLRYNHSHLYQQLLTNILLHCVKITVPLLD